MARIEPYARALGITDVEGLFQHFVATLVDTNRTHSYFVDWDKVRRHVNSLRVELGILSSVVGTERPLETLRALLGRYPEAAKAIPILAAIRDKRFKVLEDVDAPAAYTEIDFQKDALTDAGIEAILHFCEEVGIGSLLSSLTALRDYVYGVEVGIDTNARKNRSGKAMENLIEPILEKLATEQSLTLVSQKKFAYLEGRYGLEIPPWLRDRKFDAVVFNDDYRLNVEMNYYGGGGSKPEEIVDSYIGRQNELRRASWEFVWLTDGPRWRRGANQLRKAFHEMDYILNINFSLRGVLSAILRSL